METDSRKTPRKTKAKIEDMSVKLTSEEAGSFLENIKIEWNMFWLGLVGEDEAADEAEQLLKTDKLNLLSIEQLKQITRTLSQDRKRINQRIEQIHAEIEMNNERLESIQLVGGDTESTLEEINKLSDIGQKLSLQLQKIDEQMHQIHLREDELKGI
jgi:methyl-accepting chemotaxis protein